MKILVACEESQRVCTAFREKGHLAYSCDIVPTSGYDPEWHIQSDVIPLLNQGWDMIIAFPPCTHLCNSGQRWFKEGLKDYKLQREAISFFYKFVLADCPKVCIENPLGIMSTCYRKPDQIIQPWMFGHPEKKSTCLWLKGLPLLHPENDVSYILDSLTDKEVNRILWLGSKHSVERSKTFPGVALAMANQWG